METAPKQRWITRRGPHHGSRRNSVCSPNPRRGQPKLIPGQEPRATRTCRRYPRRLQAIPFDNLELPRRDRHLVVCSVASTFTQSFKGGFRCFVHKEETMVLCCADRRWCRGIVHSYSYEWIPFLPALAKVVSVRPANRQEDATACTVVFFVTVLFHRARVTETATATATPLSLLSRSFVGTTTSCVVAALGAFGSSAAPRSRYKCLLPNIESTTMETMETLKLAPTRNSATKQGAHDSPIRHGGTRTSVTTKREDGRPFQDRDGRLL